MRFPAVREIHALLLSALLLSVSFAEEPAPPVSTPEAQRQRGEEIYAAQCAACHGRAGEGVEAVHPERLEGDLSIGALTKLIDETMPEDNPGACVDADAAAVAAYIHYSFYSEAARIRNRPPRRTLTRLTGTQLRQSLADLYAHFEGVAAVSEERGLKGTYYATAERKRENEKIERLDPVLDFDFGHASPGEGIAAEEFAITWRGGLRTDVTGRYEIVIRSTCSFVCNFGHHQRELINNHVQSGDKTEFRESVYLTAGRVYPLQLNFVQRKRKTEQPPARISLSWIPPYGTEAIVPPRHLIPNWQPPAFSLSVALPPDDRSYGYDRGIAVSREWDEATTAAALEFAQFAADELWPRFRGRGSDDMAASREKLREFLGEIVETAFRRPLDEELKQLYIERQLESTPDDLEAMKRCLLLTLKSPRFLYPLADADQPVSQRVANRLALTLFDSLPSDRWLIEQSRAGGLETEDQVRAAAQRMVNDYRTRGKVRELMYEWLNLSHMGEISKNQEAFPGFNAELVSDLRASLDAFLDTVVWSESSDYRQLLLADWAYTTPRLAEYYGTAWQPADPQGEPLRRSVSDPQLRRGVLTHPYLMSKLAYHDASSPIHRGVFLVRHILGRTLRPPDEAFTPLSPDLHPGLTTRERVQLQTGGENCQVCHTRINGLGFILENYDAVGKHRLLELDKPIQVDGHYTASDGTEVAFDGPVALAAYLAESTEAQRAFINRTFQHLVKQPAAAYGADTLDKLVERFASSGYSIRELLVEIAVVAAMNHDPLSEQDI